MKMKKILVLGIASVVMLGTVATGYAETENSVVKFNDLKSTNWAYKYVSPLTQKGIVKGYSDGSFKPSNTVTYGEFIKLCLVANTGEDIGNSKSGNWAKSYYDKALELKYFGQTDIKENQLDTAIPRYEMALIISNILGETKIDNYSTFESDLKDIDSSVKNDYDIIKAYASGIITGYEDNTFKPENTLTRAESSTVIYRLIDESARVLPKVETEQVVKTNVKDIASNYKEFWITSAVSNVYDSDLAKVISYKIVKDASPYKIVDSSKNGGKSFNSQGLETVYFIKDRKVIEYVGCGFPREDKITRGRTYKTDITTVDYIAFIPSDSDERMEVEMTIIVNPFKKL